MEKKQIKKFFAGFKNHIVIFIRGMIRIIYGAAIAGLFAMAAYGFISIPSDGGWTAVFDFVASAATLVVAFANVYVIGGGTCKRRCKNG